MARHENVQEGRELRVINYNLQISELLDYEILQIRLETFVQRYMKGFTPLHILLDNKYCLFKKFSQEGLGEVEDDFIIAQLNLKIVAYSDKETICPSSTRKG